MQGCLQRCLLASAVHEDTWHLPSGKRVRYWPGDVPSKGGFRDVTEFQSIAGTTLLPFCIVLVSLYFHRRIVVGPWFGYVALVNENRYTFLCTVHVVEGACLIVKCVKGCCCTNFMFTSSLIAMRRMAPLVSIIETRAYQASGI